MGRGVQDIDGTGNIEKILYDGRCADIHDRGLVPGVRVASRTPARARAPGLVRAQAQAANWMAERTRAVRMTAERVTAERMTA